MTRGMCFAINIRSQCTELPASGASLPRGMCVFKNDKNSPSTSVNDNLLSLQACTKPLLLCSKKKNPQVLMEVKCCSKGMQRSVGMQVENVGFMEARFVPQGMLGWNVMECECAAV